MTFRRDLSRAGLAKHWRLVLGVLATLYGVARAILDFIGYIDIVLSPPTWLGRVMEIFTAPPSWAALPIVIVGLLLIWWDFKRRRPVHVHHKELLVATNSAATLSTNVIRAREYVPIHQVVEHVAARLGDENTKAKDFCGATRRAIRQVAADGKVMLRGKKQLEDGRQFMSFSAIHTPIPASYWTVSVLNYLTTEAQHQGDYHTDPETGYSWGPKGIEEKKRYAEVEASWNDVVALWPIGEPEAKKSQEAERRALIKDARQLVASACAEHGAGTDFRKVLETSTTYDQLRPYLTTKFQAEVGMAGRVIIVPPRGSPLPGLAHVFLDELERLEKEWGLL